MKNLCKVEYPHDSKCQIYKKGVETIQTCLLSLPPATYSFLEATSVTNEEIVFIYKCACMCFHSFFSFSFCTLLPYYFYINH